ncbi:MAG: DNA cytosine methyltransferase [Deltaproteobacteria bacterium]|nr:DNA cytosine methyltransferase [Deltaproteobacteria bacterium]
MKITNKTAIDLYCGSGAVTAGLKSAGFQVVCAIDVDPIACATYRANHPEVHLFEEDIKTISPKRFANDLKGSLDLLAVCAPCQPFSNRNRHKSTKDQRAKLVLEALSFVEELKPKLVFFENVPGIGRQPVFNELAEKMVALGYHLSPPKKIDAADLGVPQRRQRMILIGARNDDLLTQASKINFSKRRTVFDVIGNLPSPPVGIENIENDVLHYSRRHSVITIERLQHIPHDGGSRDNLPPQLQLRCHKDLNKNSYPDSYGRLKWRDVAPTLTTGCTDLTKGRYAHPVEDRAITLREAARLQSFPDDYIFVGNASQIATQIGNSVPPTMMHGIAKTLYSALSNNSSASL